MDKIDVQEIITCMVGEECQEAIEKELKKGEINEQENSSNS